MLEAKSRFAKFMALDGTWKWFFTGVGSWPGQLEEQSKAAAAAGMTVEWHVQEKPVADYIRRLAKGYTNVTVLWDPMP